MAFRVIGVFVAALLCVGAYLALDNYGQFANVAGWTGDKDLRWLRVWLTEFRMPLLCIAGFLTLSILSWLWQRLGLGH